MDDFNVSSLHESKNEWGARLLTILTPLIIEGFKSIFDESYKLCCDNNETEKYLMTFQNFITAMRVGKKQKKIDINIPKLDDFIHKCYINVARKMYKNVYLFDLNCQPLQVQKNNRELELIIQECILNAVRDSIPLESILKAYMDETVEEDVIEEIKEQLFDNPITSEKQAIFEGKGENNVSLKFNDVDSAISKNGKEELIKAPKTLERLEEISTLRNIQRKIEEEDADEKLKISNEEVSLDSLDVQLINPEEIKLDTDLLFDDIEILA